MSSGQIETNLARSASFLTHYGLHLVAHSAKRSTEIPKFTLCFQLSIRQICRQVRGIFQQMEVSPDAHSDCRNEHFLLLESSIRALTLLKSLIILCNVSLLTMSRKVWFLDIWKGHKDVEQSTSNSHSLGSRGWRAPLAFLAVACLMVGALGFFGTPVRAAGSEPCDIYAAGGTPCVAAHSTVRALFSAYNGNLYQVRRSSDNTTLNIGVLSAGGFANAAAQDSFCANTSCVITIIYDQSGHGNNLTQAPGGGAARGPDNLANASQLPLTVGGHHVYGVYIAPGTGYRDDNTSGIATGDNPEGEYAIFDGTHYNGGCCFDYGNAETSNNDTGNGHMEAIYFGNIRVWGYGSGNGPWVMADLENGLFSGVNAGYNSGDKSITSHYVTAIVKGGHNVWAIKAGNAQSGSLTTMYNGPRPNVSGYNPMHKEGAIILGIGGDNSKGAAGSFFEGAMTSNYPSDATENAVQANIVAAGYGK
jgi:hypothetical protein